MGKTEMCLLMLQILNARGVVSAGELATLMQTKQRNIFEYKQELEECGYDIKTIRGVHGGYLLEKSCLMPSIKLDEAEREALMDAQTFVNSKSEFLSKASFNKALGKIFSSVSLSKENSSITIIDRYPLLMPEKEIAQRYNAILEAIEEKKKLVINYLSFKNQEKKHVIHPYRVYIYNNAWFVIGWNETVNNVGYFKINRIISYEKLKETFVVLKTFNFSDYVDSFGMKNNGEFYEIKLKVMNQYAAMVKERVFGKDQVIESIDEKTTILTCKMQNKGIIISFVLGFGCDAVVLEPEWLREELRIQTIKIQEIYKK